MKGNLLSGERRAQQHAQRLAWLTAHPELLKQLPGTTDDVTEAHSDALNRALRGMKLERLYAPTAAAVNARWWIRGLVDELRKPTIAATR